MGNDSSSDLLAVVFSRTENEILETMTSDTFLRGLLIQIEKNKLFCLGLILICFPGSLQPKNVLGPIR